jgi:serine/threonine protein kinase
VNHNDLESSAVLFDFVDQFHEDSERGPIPPLDHYLLRFPKYAEVIKKSYADLVARGALAESPDRSRLRSRIGAYRIVRELGRGGQGAVYLAEDTRTGRIVALKVLSSPLGTVSDKRRRRLRREADIVARLEHPAICSVLDADLEGPTPCIAMRYVEGATLLECLEHARALRLGPAPLVCRPTSVEEVRSLAAFFAEIAQALHVAHEASVVHRDIKPANLCVAKDLHPVVLDFGLALDEESLETALTQTGEVFGTFAYMAPEQLATPRVPLDRRVDIHALGVTLYEALTLERPFARADVDAARAGVLRPSRLNPAIPRDLEAVCLRAIERSRDDRYATAAEFAADLDNVRHSRPTRARAPSSGGQLIRRARRNPWTSASIAVGALALSAAAIFFWSWRVEASQRTAAAAFMRWRDGDARPEDWAVVERVLPDRGDDARRILLENPRSREARDLFLARLASSARGADRNEFRLVSPRARIADTRPRLVVTTTLDAARSWPLVASIELPGSSVAPIECRANQLAGSAGAVFELPAGTVLIPGEWRWSVTLDESPTGANGEQARIGSEIFEVVASERQQEILRSVEPTGYPVLDRHLRAAALLDAGLASAARSELDALSPPMPVDDALRHEQLVARTSALLGDAASVRAAYERWLALQASGDK